MRILLLNPVGEPRDRYEDTSEHLGLGYLAAMLRKGGHTVEILDASLMYLSRHQTLRLMSKTRFDLLGIGVYQVAAGNTFAIVKALRQGGYSGHITLGGHFPTFKYQEILENIPEVNSIVRGEGEYPLLELANTLEKGGSLREIQNLAFRDGDSVIVNPMRPLIENLDELPFPARDTLALYAGRGSAHVSSSRGCWGTCSYCSVTSFYRLAGNRVWRARSTESVAEEIEQLMRDHWVRFINFVDDNFIGPGQRGEERVLQLMDEFRRRKLSFSFGISTRPDQVSRDLFNEMKATGLVRVFLGVESGLQKDLDYYDKHLTVEQNRMAVRTLRELNIPFDIGFMPFHRDTSPADIIENLTFLNSLGFKRVTGYPLWVLAGTRVEQQMAAQGLLHGPFYWPRYTFRFRSTALVVNLVSASRRLVNIWRSMKGWFKYRFRYNFNVKRQ